MGGGQEGVERDWGEAGEVGWAGGCGVVWVGVEGKGIDVYGMCTEYVSIMDREDGGCGGCMESLTCICTCCCDGAGECIVAGDLARDQDVLVPSGSTPHGL